MFPYQKKAKSTQLCPPCLLRILKYIRVRSRVSALRQPGGFSVKQGGFSVREDSLSHREDSLSWEDSLSNREDSLSWEDSLMTVGQNAARMGCVKMTNFSGRPL